MSRVVIRVRRQDYPGDLPYWEEFDVTLRPAMTVLAALEDIGVHAKNAEGNPSPPVIFESSCRGGMCGSCAMIINGRVRLACKTLVEDLEMPVTVEPLEKCPIDRDLKVDRAQMFDEIEKFETWIDVSGIEDAAPPVRVSPEELEKIRPFMSCIMCGACAEACPQVNPRSHFAGAFIFALVLPLNEHPTGKLCRASRLDSLAGKGGIADCAGANACEAACPMGIPLGEAISRLGWSATVHSLKKMFWS